MSEFRKYLIPIVGIVSAAAIACVATIAGGDLAYIALPGSLVLLGLCIGSWAHVATFEDDKTKDESSVSGERSA